MNVVDMIALTGEAEEPDLEIEYPDDEVILLERPRASVDRYAG